MSSIRAWAAALSAVVIASIAMLAGGVAWADSTQGLGIFHQPSISWPPPRDTQVTFDHFHARIYVTGPVSLSEEQTSGRPLSVFDEKGNLVRRLLPDHTVLSSALSDDGRTLAVGTAGQVFVFDAATLTQQRVYSGGINFQHLAVADGAVWFATTNFFDPVGRVDLATGAVTTPPNLGPSTVSQLLTVPGHSELVAIGSTLAGGPESTVIDVGGSSPSVVATTNQQMSPPAVSGDGQHLFAFDGTAVQELALPSLTRTRSVYTNPNITALAASWRGNTLSAGDEVTDWANSGHVSHALHTVDTETGTDAASAFGYREMIAVGFGSLGQNIAVTHRDYEGDMGLAISDGSGRIATSIGGPTAGIGSHEFPLGQPIPLDFGVGAADSGTGPTCPCALHLTRLGPDGAVPIPVTETSAGAHATDIPSLPGEYRYRFTYDGDATFSDASSETFVEVRQPTRMLPLDFPGSVNSLTPDGPLHRLLLHTTSGYDAIDESGVIVARNDNLPGASDPALAPDGLHFYVADECAGTVTEIDALTLLPVGTVDSTGAPGPDSVAFAGDDLWIGFAGSSTSCPDRSTADAAGIARLHPATQLPPDVFRPDQGYLTHPVVSGNSHQPSRLFVSESSGTHQILIHDGAPDWNVKDVSSGFVKPLLLDDGRVLSGFNLLNADLTPAASYGTNASFWTADPAGTRIGLVNQAFAVLATVRTVGGDPLGTIRTSLDGTPNRIVAVSFSGDGNSFYVLEYDYQQGWHLFVQDTRLAAVLRSTAPLVRTAETAIPVTATLLAPSGTALPGVPLTVTRTDRTGVVTTLPVATTGAGGVVSLDDLPATTGGPWTYRFAYAGDATTAPTATAVTVAGVPDAPTALTAVPAAGGATASWHVPAADGGAPVTGYLVSVDDAAPLSMPASALSTILSGLAAGATHSISVSALNAAGTGSASTTSVAIPASPSPTPTPTPTPSCPQTTLSGPASRTTTYGTTVPLAGTAKPGAVVAVWFQNGGSGAYVQRRTLTAGRNGAWSSSYVATDDQRVYATSGSSRSATVSVLVTPTIAGGPSHVVRRNTSYTITGTATAGRVLTVHFHKAGTASNDYSILRTVTVGPNGRWSRTYVASVDYRFFATLPNGQKSPTVLVQAR